MMSKLELQLHNIACIIGTVKKALEEDENRASEWGALALAEEMIGDLPLPVLQGSL